MDDCKQGLILFDLSFLKYFIKQDKGDGNMPPPFVKHSQQVGKYQRSK